MSDTPRPQSLRLVLWVLLVIYIFNFLDRQIVNILAEPIRKSLGLNDIQIGLMTGVAFAAFYTLLGLPIARYADRPETDRVKLISLALLVWSVMTALCGRAQDFVQLLLARIGVGVGEAGCTPAAHSLISDMAEPKKRASAMAFYASGIPIGTLAGLVIGGVLAKEYGWRAAFLIVGLPGILLALVTIWLIRDPRLTAMVRPQQVEKTGTNWVELREILKSRAFLLLLAAGTFASFLSYGKATWNAIFFQRTHHLDVATTGIWLGLVSGIGGTLGSWLGGWLAVRYGSEDRRWVLLPVAIGMAVAPPMLLAGYYVSNWSLSLLLLLIPAALNSLYYGPTYSSVQGLVHPRNRALASAVMLFCQNLIGLGLGPLFFGMISHWAKPMAGDDSVRWVLIGAAWFGFLPAFLFWRCSRHLNAELDQKG